MAIAVPDFGTRKRRRSSSTLNSRSSEALSTLATAVSSPPPIPQIELPPTPQLPPPQPVSVPDPLAMLSRAVSQFQGIPTVNTIQTLANLATAHAQNILQSRLQAQEQALQQALGLGELAMSRARLGLEQAQMAQDAWYREQQLRQEEARRRFEEQQLQRDIDDERRRLALNTILSIVNEPSLDEPAARAQIETIFAVYPELRAYISQAQIEALLRARFGKEPQTSGYSGPTLRQRFGSFLDRLVPFSERYLMPTLR